MNYCEEIWNEGTDLELTSSDLDHCSQILSQAFSSLMRILQAMTFIPLGLYQLFKIHFLLDLSWDELRTTICSLRPLDNEGEGLMQKLLSVPLASTPFLVPVDSVMWDFACGSLRVMQRTLRGKLDKYIV
jgi:hypothetical protein